MADRSLLIKVVCFFRDASSGPFGSIRQGRGIYQLQALTS